MREDGRVKIAVDIPDELARRAKAEAAAHGLTFGQLLLEALEERLDRERAVEPAWRSHAGALRELRRETRRIEETIAEELDVVDEHEP